MFENTKKRKILRKVIFSLQFHYKKVQKKSNIIKIIKIYIYLNDLIFI